MSVCCGPGVDGVFVMRAEVSVKKPKMGPLCFMCDSDAVCTASVGCAIRPHEALEKKGREETSPRGGVRRARRDDDVQPYRLISTKAQPSPNKVSEIPTGFGNGESIRSEAPCNPVSPLS